MQDIRPLVPTYCARPLHALVVHCSATASGQSIGADAARVIDGWHRVRGFRRTHPVRHAHQPHLGHIGYHYVVDVDGRLQQGRHLKELGAHVAGHNTGSVGICLVGGSEPQARYTAAQWATLANLVTLLRFVAPAAGVLGHRDLFPDRNGDGRVDRHDWLKTCPGFDVAAWLSNDMRPLPQHVWAS